MALTVIESDVYVNGSLVARTFTAPTSSVSNNSIEASAGVEASKLQHQHQITHKLTSHNTDAGVTREVLHRVKGATGTIIEFGVGATQAAGASSSVVVQLRKNGTTILSTAITLDSTTAAFTLDTASTYTSTALVAQDVLEVDVQTVSGAALPKGLFACLTIREDAQ
jgi:hypothetical protein